MANQDKPPMVLTQTIESSARLGFPHYVFGREWMMCSPSHLQKMICSERSRNAFDVIHGPYGVQAISH
jgi:hypothetical protein